MIREQTRVPGSGSRAPGAAVLLLLCAGSAAWAGEENAAAIAGLEVLTPAVRRYERVEVAWTPAEKPANPFDPNAAAVDGVFDLPSGRRVRVPGFWFQDYRRGIANPEATGIERVETLTPVGRPGWRVRFSSGEVGRHRVALEVQDARGLRRSAELTFEVGAGPGGASIRVSPRNRAYLEDESGAVFFPIGQNLCMYQRREGTYYFDRLLPRFRAGGGNYVRLWQEYYVPREPTDVSKPSAPGEGTFAGFPLETEMTGLGRYDLESAWRLDYVADLCRRLDVRWQITFEMATWWLERNQKWKRNRYNAANGGPCARPADYFTNPAARELVRRRLRYSVARWSWDTHLVAWELWNEVDNVTGFTSDACAAWHREMGAYLKSIDPWRHLVTTSWRDRQTFALPEIDVVQGHSYWWPPYDAAEYALQDTDHLMRGFGKPFFFGEQGIERGVTDDPEGKHFHDCLWSTALSGAAGTGMYWWWHNYIEPNNLYHHYTPLARFVQDVDWPAHEWQQVKLGLPSLPVSLRVYGLVAADRAYLWVHDPLAFRIVDERAERGPRQAGARLNVVGLEDGNYQVEWWDTTKGEVVRTDYGRVYHLRHFGCGLTLTPPDFWGDIAARVKKGQPPTTPTTRPARGGQPPATGR